jgi:hypothetical protein
MKLHSFVDIITNSSSTTFIKPPDLNKLEEVANELGFDRIEVRLSHNAIDDFRYDIEDYLEQNNLPLIDVDRKKNDLNYWLTQPLIKRLEAVTFLISQTVDLKTTRMDKSHVVRRKLKV